MTVDVRVQFAFKRVLGLDMKMLKEKEDGCMDHSGVRVAGRMHAPKLELTPVSAIGITCFFVLILFRKNGV